MLERCGRIGEGAEMVSEIFSGICNSDHYLYPGAEAALHCGCSSGVASGRVFLEILSERAAT